MLLDALKDFEWYNEPENVCFPEKGMMVTSKSQTDFWQSKQHNFSKDDGHFFYIETASDFRLIIKWSFNLLEKFSQCGLMIRANPKEWFKISLLSDNKETYRIGSSLTKDGSSDWAINELTMPVNEIWYKLVRNQDEYIASYSLDGVKYHQHRLFYFPSKDGKVKTGAYIASPQTAKFNACLEILNLEA